MSSCIRVPRIRARTEDLPSWNTSPTKQQPWPEGNSSLVLIYLTLVCFSVCLFCLFFYFVPVSRPALFMNPLCSVCLFVLAVFFFYLHLCKLLFLYLIFVLQETFSCGVNPSKWTGQSQRRMWKRKLCSGSELST